MKTPLPKFPHHRGVPEHHFGDKTPLLATLAWASASATGTVALARQPASALAGPAAQPIQIFGTFYKLEENAPSKQKFVTIFIDPKKYSLIIIFV